MSATHDGIPTSQGSPVVLGALSTAAFTLLIALGGIVASVLLAVLVYTAFQGFLGDSQLLRAVLVMVLGVAACFGYFWGTNKLLDTIYPSRSTQAASNILRANQIRPWLFLGPSIVLLGTYLVWQSISAMVLI